MLCGSHTYASGNECLEHDDNGVEIRPEKVMITQPAREVGEVYMLRVEECLILEAALQRR
ncbi:hypothetical protein Pecwa_2159 [Pectobacterium parmentieri WPP163]|nr:hypothetical protein Pecwa_2159 [Pectobacterium parmentieri WPP163]POW27621.1 hypothetical protein PB20LOC_02268 [Pectobacterium parmentieri]